jgi:hypothetical protein
VSDTKLTDAVTDPVSGQALDTQRPARPRAPAKTHAHTQRTHSRNHRNLRRSVSACRVRSACLSRVGRGWIPRATCPADLSTIIATSKPDANSGHMSYCEAWGPESTGDSGTPEMSFATWGSSEEEDVKRTYDKAFDLVRRGPSSGLAGRPTHSALARLLSRFPTAGHVRYRARLTAAAPFRGITGPAARRR